ncbi:MAG: hypothetical protein GF353_28910 [Candidatus Lokiarchaeota archaeon]|nr:hypothetical protein [Candidatus Lokiarchaeota archaeon]
MSYKEKKLRKFKQTYSPIGFGPNEEQNKIYNEEFKPLVDRKDLNFFIELYDSENVKLKAWSFLGIHHILKEPRTIKEKEKSKVQEIIKDLLDNHSKIEYYGGSSEQKTTLREHHLGRVCELDTSITFKPVYEYVRNLENKTDRVMGELLESVLSKNADGKVESLIAQRAENLNSGNLTVKNHIVNAIGNYGQNFSQESRTKLTNIFKNFLKDLDDKNLTKEEIKEVDLKLINRKKEALRKSILKVGAILDMELLAETLNFVNDMATPYEDLYQIAKKYRDNDKFKSAILKKLSETNNPNLVKDVLRAVLAIKDNIQNWEEIVLENLKKYQIVDGDLIVDMEKLGVYDEDMLIDFFREGREWQLEFIREFILNNPEKLNSWTNFRDEVIKVLKFDPKSIINSYDARNVAAKKELIFKLIIDLEKKDLVKYCVENFKILEDSDLKKMTLFIIIKLGKEDLMLDLKEYLSRNEEDARFFRRFWRTMQSREWKFFY